MQLLKLFLSFYCQCLLLLFLDVRLATNDVTQLLTTILEPTKWTRKGFDADGYFLLQHAEKFLTADDASSLTIQGMHT